MIGKPKRKRDIQLRIILGDRTLKGDLILKTILRQMRKSYLKDFNGKMKFQIMKRNKPEDFLIVALKEYI